MVSALPQPLGSPFLRHLGGGLCRGPGSLRVPHYLTQDHRDLGGIQGSGNQRVHQSALISNFGTSKSRTCARLGCLRIERWAREGIARANVAFPPNCNVHRRDRERQLYVGSRRRSIVSNARIPALRRSRCNGKNAQIPVIPKWRGEWVNSTLSARSVRSGNGRNAPESGPRRYGSRAPGTDFPCIIAVALIRPFPSGV